MQLEPAIASELESFVEVNLEANLCLQNENQKQVPVDVLVLSMSGAILKANTAPPIGEAVGLNLKADFSTRLIGTVKNYLKWNDSKRVLFIKFENLSHSQSQVLHQTVDYFTKLKRAGVQLGP